MQKKSRISFGPGAASIILIVVILSMSVLALLSLVNARNDRHFSDRSAQVTEAVYALSARAEITYANLDALMAEQEGTEKDQLADALAGVLPEGVSLEGDTLSWVESDDLRDLECTVQITEEKGRYSISWIKHRMTMRTEDTWNLVSF